MAEKVENEKKISNAGAVAAARGIVKVEPKPSNGFTSKVIDFLEKIAVKLMHDSSLKPQYLTGNFAPRTHETPPTKDLPFQGYLPVSTFYHFPNWLKVFSRFYFLRLWYHGT